MAYWHSVCPVCEEGRLFVATIRDAKKLFLLCEACDLHGGQLKISMSRHTLTVRLGMSLVLTTV
jgi:uncharacterized protein (DUF983 family)